MSPSTDADGSPYGEPTRVSSRSLWCDRSAALRVMPFVENDIDPSAQGLQAVVAADWVGDGNLDVLAASDDRIAWYPNDDGVLDSSVRVYVAELGAS